VVARIGILALGTALFVAAVIAYPGTIDWSRTWEWRSQLFDGLRLTALVSSAALLLALLFGTGAGLARVSRSVVLEEASAAYVQLVRGTPFLVQIYIWYFCVSYALRLQDLGGSDNAIYVGIVGLGAFGGAYVTEIVRAGVEGVDRGQWEAARSLGLSHGQTLRHVVLPQAFRVMIPPLTGEAVSLVKESSLLSVISVAELTYHAKNMRAATFESFASLIPLAILYLCLTLPLTLLTQRLERRLAGPSRMPVAEL
jgi:polar amino acid transport system permease protein